MRERRLFIDGAWVSGEGGRHEIRDPANGELVGATELASAGDIDKAVGAASRALPAWSATHADQRARILHRAAALIDERIDAIADLLTREQGKPIP